MTDRDELLKRIDACARGDINGLAGYSISEIARDAAAALRAPAGHGGRESDIIRIIEDEMLDAWNTICSDTDCHPLDISQVGRRRLEFHSSHWSRLTAECAANKILALSQPPAQPQDDQRSDETGQGASALGIKGEPL